MKRREFLRGLLIASVAVGVGKLVPEDIEQSKDVLLVLKEHLADKHYNPNAVFTSDGCIVNFCVTKEVLEDEEVFNELMDEYGLPDQKPDEVRLGYLNDDWAQGVIRVVLKYKSI